MASKTVSDLKIKVGLQGEETFSRLKGQFRALEKTVGVTDKGIQELRRGVLEFSRAGGKSTQLINGQIQALKGLQAQTTINSGTYNKLTKDIEKLNAELGQLDGSVTKVKNNLGSFTVPGYGTDQFASAIQARRQELNGLAADSREYLELLTGIRAYERRQGFVTGRQEVSAAAEAAKRTMPARAMAVGLPDTYAGLRQRISELTAEIDHLEIGSDDLRNAENELIATQRALSEVLGQTSAAYDELARKEEGAIRRAKKLADIQEYHRTQGPRSPLFGTGGYRDPVTGAMIAGGTPEGIVPLRRGAFRGDNIFPVSSAVEAMRTRRAAAMRPRMGPGGYAQVAGAALSGGIFGGPEGAGGALLGGVLGGVPGAFAGAAAGAQLSMARQSLGGAAEYAAQIGKLKIALEGVAGSQEDYQRALRSAADVTQRLNVPQETAVAGMTRLTAAVKGAGGEVDDASLVFKNVTAAIKATGGGAQDVQSAITAMVQVFSKGKVSAEELSGQLGERLPGAVTMFAKANDMTLPELQKALKAGTVGLNELMNFIEELGIKYGKTANDIAKSNEEAGARLGVAMKELQLQVGQSLLPIGAQLQDAFAEFIKNVTPSLVKAVENLGKGIKFLIENASNIKTIAQFAATFALVNLATKAFIAMNGPLQTAFLAIQAGFGATSQQAIVAQMKISAAAASLKAFALAAAAPIGITIVLFGLQKLVQARMELARLKQQAGAGASEVFAGATRETVESAQAKQKAYLPKLEASVADLEKQYKDLQKPGLAQIGPLGAGRLEVIKGALDRKRLELQFSKDVLGLDPKQYTSLQEELKRTKFDPVDPEGTGDKEKSKDITAKEAELRLKLIAAQEKGVGFAAAQAKYNLDMYLAIKDSETPEKNRVAKAEAYKNFVQAIAGEMKGIGDMQMEENKRLDDINRSLEDRKYKLGLINEEKYRELQLEREKKRLEELYQGPAYEGKRAEALDLYRQEIDPTPFEEMRQNIAQLKQELTDLLSPVNQIVGAAATIGQAFSTSFINVINGSQTAREALASFFKNTANYFLDMAAQIIAKMIQMAILNSIVGLLPGAGAAPMSSKGYFDPISGKGIAGPNFGLAKGGIVDSGTVKRYAMGGIVDKPTLFQYADGGTGRFGLMGEAGPEAILPLKRGSDGKLGVASTKSVGNIVVNVDASGSSVEGNDTESKRLGEAIGVAIRQELIKQKRPGGLLA